MDEEPKTLIVACSEDTPLLSKKTLAEICAALENVNENNHASRPSNQENFRYQSSGQQRTTLPVVFPVNLTRHNPVRMSSYGTANLVSPTSRLERSQPTSFVVQCAAPCFLCSILPSLLSNIVFRLLLHIALLTWPLSVGIVGATSIIKCPGIRSLPVMMTIIGFLGFIILFLRIATIMTLHVMAYLVYPIRWIILSLEFLFAILFIAKNMVSYYYECSFNPSSQYYCDEDFYNLAFRLNIVSFVVLLLWIWTYIKPTIRHLFSKTTFY